MTYAVRWSENDGPPHAGVMALDDRFVELSDDRRIRYGDLADIFLERRVGGALSRRPSLVLVCRDGVRLEIESLQGLGVLHELAEELVEARGKAAA
jgi:hypothetical protein